MVHDQRCPYTSKVVGVKKWKECWCTIHTCYDAKKAGVKRSKKDAPVYRDFLPEAYIEYPLPTKRVISPEKE